MSLLAILIQLCVQTRFNFQFSRKTPEELAESRNEVAQIKREKADLVCFVSVSLKLKYLLFNFQKTCKSLNNYLARNQARMIGGTDVTWLSHFSFGETYAGAIW